MRQLGFRSWRGISRAVRWTFTTAAGRRFFAGRLFALSAGLWVMDRYGNLPGVMTVIAAVSVAGIVAPPPPDDVGRHDQREAGLTTPEVPERYPQRRD